VGGGGLEGGVWFLCGLCRELRFR